MADDVSNFVRIHIPSSLVQRHESLRDALQHTTIAAGGGFRTEVAGVWYDDKGKAHDERVFVFQWNYSKAKHRIVDERCRVLVQLLFQLGEQAVMKERHYSEDFLDCGYRARILYSDVPQQAPLPIMDMTQAEPPSFHPLTKH